jgi:hypothetical protein
LQCIAVPTVHDPITRVTTGIAAHGLKKLYSCSSCWQASLKAQTCKQQSDCQQACTTASVASQLVRSTQQPTQTARKISPMGT